MLASLLYPYDEDALALIDGWLVELETQHQVRRYERDGHAYLEVRNWLQHQKIDKPSLSKLPPFANVREDSPRIREDSLRIKDQGRDQGVERTKEATGGIDPCMFASGVMLECRLAGKDLRMVLEEVGRAEAKHGEDLEALAEKAIAAWQSYSAIVLTLEYRWGAARFFGEGYWKDPDGWPRVGVKLSAKELQRKEFEERSHDDETE